MTMTRRRSRLVKLAVLSLLVCVSCPGIMIYRAQRYGRAYDRIPLGLPFDQAELVLESLSGRYDDKELGKCVFVKHEGAFHLPKGPMTEHEVGAGRTDYANPTTGEVRGRSRVRT